MDHPETPSSLPAASPAAPAPEAPRRFSRLGVAGLIVGLLALVAAVMSPWIVEQIEPDRRSLDELAVDTAVKIKDRVAAKIKGEVYVAKPDHRTGVNWAKVYPAPVVGVGILAACVGVISFVLKDDHRLSGATIGVGLAAVFFQYFLLLAGAILAIVLIAVILSMMGVDPG